MHTSGSTQGEQEVLTDARVVRVMGTKGEPRPRSWIITWGRCLRVGVYCDYFSVILVEERNGAKQQKEKVMQQIKSVMKRIVIHDLTKRIAA